MATATRKYETVTKQVPTGVTLELTKTEAIVLLYILFQVGGHNERSPRKFVDTILQALENAGIELANFPLSFSKNGIYFEEHILGQDADNQEKNRVPENAAITNDHKTQERLG